MAAGQGQLKTAQLLSPGTRGMNSDDLPANCPPDQAPLIRNMLPGQNGRLRMRGPSTVGLNSSTVARQVPSGIIAYPNKTVTYFRAVSSTLTTEPWQQRISKLAAVAGLAQAAGTTPLAQDFDAATNTLPGALARQLNFSHAWARTGALIVGCAFDSVDNVDNAGGSPLAANSILLQNGIRYRLTPILSYDTSAAIGTAPTNYGDAKPYGAVDIKIWLGRLFLAGGMLRNAGGNSPLRTNHLWYSQPIVSMLNTSADFVDPITTAPNTIQVGEDDLSDAILAIAPLQRMLVVFKRGSTHVVTGAGPATWATRQIASDIGCIDPRSVVVSSGSVFWLSKYGFMQFDGANVVNISRPILNTQINTALTNTDKTQRITPITGSIVSGAALDAENVLFLVAREDYNNTASGEMLDVGLIYNSRNRTWVTVNTIGEATRAVGAGLFGVAGGPTRVIGTGNSDFVYAWGLHDTAQPYFITNRIDKWTAPDNTNWSTYLSCDGSKVIGMRYDSPTLRLGSPQRKALVKRVIVELSYSATTGDGPNLDVLRMDDGGSGGVMFSPSGGRINPLAAAAGPQIASFDVYQECESMRVSIYNSGTCGSGDPNKINNFEIHSITVEYQPAQEQRFGA